VGGEPKRDSLLWGSLFLLDIQMPGMTGFDVLRLLDGPSPAVIFTTAYDHYAVQAFEVSAIDYLLKPIAQARLTQALYKVTLLGEKKEPTDWNDKINTVLDKLEHPEYAKRLAVRHLDKLHFLAGNNDGSAQGNSEDQTLVVSRENVAGLRVRLGF
jgi:DNA-binding LytR/AlgR family response regulator